MRAARTTAVGIPLGPLRRTAPTDVVSGPEVPSSKGVDDYADVYIAFDRPGERYTRRMITHDYHLGFCIWHLYARRIVL